MGTSESITGGPENTPRGCSQAEFCLRGLLDRAAIRAGEGESVEADPVLLNGLDAAVVDSDESEGLYVLACQAVDCNDKYAVGKTIEPQKL